MKPLSPFVYIQKGRIGFSFSMRPDAVLFILLLWYTLLSDKLELNKIAARWPAKAVA